MASPSLADLLSGNIPAPTPPPNPRIAPPSYRRDGLYGRTPFKLREAHIVAVTTEQVCRHCGSSHMGFGGVFYEFTGQGEGGALTMRNAAPDATKDQIERVVHETDEVPYCPTCLGKGDIASGSTGRGEGGEVNASSPAPLIKRSES